MTGIVGEAAAYVGTAVTGVGRPKVANANVGVADSLAAIDGVSMVDAVAVAVTAALEVAATPTSGTNAVGKVVVRTGNSSPAAPRRSMDPATSAPIMRRAEAIRRKWSTAFRVMFAFNRPWLLTIVNNIKSQYNAAWRRR